MGPLAGRSGVAFNRMAHVETPYLATVKTGG